MSKSMDSLVFCRVEEFLDTVLLLVVVDNVLFGLFVLIV